MSLEVGRVGVRPDQLDNYGRINPKSQFIQNLLNDLPAWTDLPVWKSGTEQLLPVNDDEPDTSPILCDIEYPVADLKNNQYFTYRQSPTQKDGKAKIRGIRGKTLVWNQLVQNGNFANTNNWSKSSGVTTSVSGNVLTVTTSADGDKFAYQNLSLIKDHKYFYTVKCNGSSVDDNPTQMVLYYGTSNDVIRFHCSSANVWETASGIVTCTGTTLNVIRLRAEKTTLTNKFTDVMVIDLTAMFGAGKEPSTLEEFTDLFPLPYYKADTGSLLDFTGTKLKTTGKNLSDKSSITCSATGYINASNSVLAKVFKGNTYTISFDNLTTLSAYIVVRVTPDGASYNVDQTKKTLTASKRCDITFTATDTGNLWLSGQATGYSSVKVFDNIQVEFGSTPSVYEAYADNETDLPISTFFPTGMKSAGAVYDELTPTRAITRVGSFTFNGTEDWVMESQGDGAKNFFIRSTSTRPDDAKKSTYNGIAASKDFHWRSSASDLTNVVYSGQSSGLVQVRVAADFISNIDATKWKTYLTSNPITIHYELAVEDVQPTMSFGD